jgi:hypothetical protein
MQELLIAPAETLSVGWEPWRRNRRVSEARVLIERGRTSGGDIVPCGVEAVVLALLFDGLIVKCWRRRRRAINRLRMRAAEQRSGKKKWGKRQQFLHRIVLYSGCALIAFRAQYPETRERPIVACPYLLE